MIEKYGIEQVSLRDAASSCKVSATAVYRHFASKEHLLIACAAKGFQRLAEAMQNTAKRVPDQLRAFGEGYLSFAYQHPKLFTFMFNADLSLARNEQIAIFLESYNYLRDVISRGVEEGFFKGSVDVLTTKAWSIVHGFATLVISKRIQVDDYAEYMKLAGEIMAGRLEGGEHPPSQQ